MLRNKEVTLHPNPTKNIVYINKIVDIFVYNNIGRLIIKDNGKNIDLTNYNSGIYNIITIFEGKINIHKIIKQ
jgi:hypothetical protein